LCLQLLLPLGGFLPPGGAERPKNPRLLKRPSAPLAGGGNLGFAQVYACLSSQHIKQGLEPILAQEPVNDAAVAGLARRAAPSGE
jgi:hypothetical protein